MNRAATILRGTVVAIVLVVVVIGALAVYYYTLPPATAKVNGASLTEGTKSASLVTNQAAGAQYITVLYNGTTYTVPAKGANSPSFGCPPGTDPSLCTILQETCGNGVGSAQEPWKTCYNCVFDAGCSGDNACDPYTHECSSPASACQIIAGGYNQAG